VTVFRTAVAADLPELRAPDEVVCRFRMSGMAVMRQDKGEALQA
jgi:hypothetical protein